MGGKQRKSPQDVPSEVPQPAIERRVYHRTPECGADISTACSFMSLRRPEPVVHQRTKEILGWREVVEVVTITPLICPRCGRGMVWDHPETPLVVVS